MIEDGNMKGEDLQALQSRRVYEMMILELSSRSRYTFERSISREFLQALLSRSAYQTNLLN
jgi:hypothetical protein